MISISKIYSKFEIRITVNHCHYDKFHNDDVIDDGDFTYSHRNSIADSNDDGNDNDDNNNDFNDNNNNTNNNNNDIDNKNNNDKEEEGG